MIYSLVFFYSILKEGPGDVDILLVDEPKFGTARKRVNLRIPHYPSLDYLGLYDTLVGLVDIVPLVQYGQFGKT